MANPEKVIDRSHLFIMSYQLEGICAGLRLTVPNGLSPGQVTVEMLKKVSTEFAAICRGRTVEDLPQISEASNPVDVLVMAETLRATLLAFLSPEELAEHRNIGFHSNDSR
jgi:hypothetical protein